MIDDDHKLLIEESKNEILLSLRSGMLKVDELKYLLQHFKDEENYEACQGLSNAYVLFKQELDEY